MLLFSGLLVACQEDNDAELNESFWLQYNKTVTVDGTPITFTTIVEDSRCPADVMCVWAGQFIAALNVNGEGVHIGGDHSVLEIQGYEIELLSIHPAEKKSYEELKEKQYRILLIVRKVV